MAELDELGEERENYENKLLDIKKQISKLNHKLKTVANKEYSNTLKFVIKSITS